MPSWKKKKRLIAEVIRPYMGHNDSKAEGTGKLTSRKRKIDEKSHGKRKVEDGSFGKGENREGFSRLEVNGETITFFEVTPRRATEGRENELCGSPYSS